MSSSHLVFIISSRAPYCYDFNEILALPSGFSYRNRFDVNWFEPNLRTQILEQRDAKVLLVLRDMDSNRLVPVRWATLFNIERIGAIVFFEYELGDLIAYDPSPRVREQQIEAHTTSFSKLHNWLPGTAEQPLLEPSVFLSTVGDGIESCSDADLGRWGSLVEAVATAPVYERVEFLRIVGLTNSNDEPAPVRRGGFMVRSNETYRIRVFQTVPRPGKDPIPTHGIHCNSFSQDVEFLRSTQQAVGKYDMLTFVMRVRDVNAGSRTAIEIPYVPDAAINGLARSSLYIPLEALPERTVKRVVTALVVLSALVLTLFPSLLSNFAPVDVTRTIATLVLIIVLTGPSRAIQSVWPTVPWKGN